ncbi:hypothetical protein [Aliterella atlantica]|uniref:hypothetical protein n=1 Tax=Aliterella atlantica TaxID=1827278 RepID=UPI001186FA92|nr:hypothetical protein [Aliterella atlantica]
MIVIRAGSLELGNQVQTGNQKSPSLPPRSLLPQNLRQQHSLSRLQRHYPQMMTDTIWLWTDNRSRYHHKCDRIYVSVNFYSSTQEH